MLGICASAQIGGNLNPSASEGERVNRKSWHSVFLQRRVLAKAARAEVEGFVPVRKVKVNGTNQG